MNILATKNLFKEYMGVEPSELQSYDSIMGIPWSVKILYGLMSDNVKICGQKRKSYIIILGFIQFFSLMCLFLFTPTDPKYVVFAQLCVNFSHAFADVIVDAMMVQQSRNDAEDGSEQLSSLSWGAMGAGGIFGSLVGGYITEKYHPKWIYLLYSIFGFITFVLGLF